MPEEKREIKVVSGKWTERLRMPNPPTSQSPKADLETNLK